ncbi:unnamed protein product [Prunus armeniaca]
MSMYYGQKVPLAKRDLKKVHCPKNKEEEDSEVLRRKKAYMLIYKRTENLELVGNADANLGKAEDDYSSTSGFLFKMVGAVVAWKSAKQSGVSSSTHCAKIHFPQHYIGIGKMKYGCCLYIRHWFYK